MIKKAIVQQETDDGFLLYIPCREKKEWIRNNSTLLVDIPDPRKISTQQRRKAYVLLGYISAWWSYLPLETVKEITKLIFNGQVPHDLANEEFSLRDCSMTTARLYISFLIDFCILHGVDAKEPLYSLCEDIPRYVWACTMNKKCAVCGKRTELHHIDTVGAGRNRNKIGHLGMKILPLCRKHHNEIHNIGTKNFLHKYMLEPIKVDNRIADLYKLNKVDKRD